MEQFVWYLKCIDMGHALTRYQWTEHWTYEVVYIHMYKPIM